MRRRARFPVVEAIHFVERDDEGRLAHAQQVEGLERLLLQPVHDVHHQDGHVAQAGPAAAQVGEALVTGGVDHQQPGNLLRGFQTNTLDIIIIIQTERSKRVPPGRPSRIDATGAGAGGHTGARGHTFRVPWLGGSLRRSRG
eukprot:7802270-Pyramimonas_sp.AAC.1